LSAQALQLGPNKNMSAGSSTASGEREQAEPYVSPDQIKALEPGECLILRSPKVWNIRIPLIELSKATKEAIGPLKINRIRPQRYVEIGDRFNSLQNVNEYIAKAQSKRASGSKKKDKSAANNPAPAIDPESKLEAKVLADAERDYLEGTTKKQTPPAITTEPAGISDDMPSDD
jgi:hypothetical protein